MEPTVPHTALKVPAAAACTMEVPPPSAGAPMAARGETAMVAAAPMAVVAGTAVGSQLAATAAEPTVVVLLAEVAMALLGQWRSKRMAPQRQVARSLPPAEEPTLPLCPCRARLPVPAPAATAPAPAPTAAAERPATVPPPWREATEHPQLAGAPATAAAAVAGTVLGRRPGEKRMPVADQAATAVRPPATRLRRPAIRRSRLQR
mmetsp:Transcript_3145/g.9083  ORF Transcript_3145/g.9083 Transcript_3145/m.9083 type:complete len:205 (+) Transcript_3145:3067-3681(+)